MCLYLRKKKRQNKTKKPLKPSMTRNGMKLRGEDNDASIQVYRQ